MRLGLRFGIWLRVGATQFPEPGLFHERVVALQHAHLEPNDAIQETALQDVAPKKPQRRVEQQLEQVRLASLFVPYAGLPSRVAVELPQVLLVGPKGEVFHAFAESSRPSGRDRHLGVIRVAHVSSAVAVEKPHQRLIPPTTATHRVAHKVVQSRHAVAIQRRTFRQVPSHFGRELGSDPLVGVQNEHPVMGRLRDRPILEIAGVDIFAFDHAAAAHLRDDIERAVGRARVGYEQFVGDQPSGLDARPDVPPFVFASDDDGQLAHGFALRKWDCYH